MDVKQATAKISIKKYQRSVMAYLFVSAFLIIVSIILIVGFTRPGILASQFSQSMESHWLMPRSLNDVVLRELNGSLERQTREQSFPMMSFLANKHFSSTTSLLLLDATNKVRWHRSSRFTVGSDYDIPLGTATSGVTRSAINMSSLISNQAMGDMNHQAWLSHEYFLNNGFKLIAEKNVHSQLMQMQNTDARLLAALSSIILLVFTGLVFAFKRLQMIADAVPLLDSAPLVIDNKNIATKSELDEIIMDRTRELERARDQALDASKAKSTFLANMSHELRTPLNAVIGYSEILAEEIEEHNLSELALDAQKIYAAGNHLLNLINDILDISKIEAGKMENHVESFNLDNALRDVVANVGSLVQQSDNTMSVELENIGDMVSDITKVRQILFNLISNALKFTHHGEVKFSAKKEIRVDSEYVVFTITDDGIGMSEEQQKVLFQPFTQADSSTTRKFGGTGLGLAICKHLCDMLGGSISVCSQPDKGTEFIVCLPLKLATTESGRKSGWFKVGPKVDPADIRFTTNGRPNMHRKKISKVLVVDDDANIRDLMERFLTREGFYAITAANAEEGLALAKTERPDLITLDVMMPEKDGWWVLSKLKSDPYLDKIPVVMLTLVEERELGFAMGADDYLAKPVDRNKLSETIIKHLRENYRGTILLLENDEPTRAILNHLLASEGLKIHIVTSGEEALNCLKEMPVDLIISSLVLPDMSGMELIDKLKADTEFCRIPVIVTSSGEINDSQRTLLKQSVERVMQNNKMSAEEFLLNVHELISARVRNH